MALLRSRNPVLPGILAAVLLSAVAFSLAPSVFWMGRQADGSIIIPTGQVITPAGTHIEVADRPLGMTINADGSLLAVVTGSNFASRSIHLIDLTNDALRQTIAIGDSFVGAAFTEDGQSLVVGGGRDNNVKFFRRSDDGQFRADGAVAISGSAPSGLSISPDGEWVYAALNLRHSVGVINARTRQVAAQVPTGSYPYTTAVTPDGAKVYITNWGGRKPEADDPTDGVNPVIVDPQTGIASSGTVSVLNAESRTIVRQIEVGLHPSGMVMSWDGKRLYVANANSDTISVIDTESDAVIKTLDVRLFAGAPLGSAPNALSISPDGNRLYVANAANNAIAIIEPDHPTRPVRGFIPTGWFPTAVAVSYDEQRLFVGSGYGFGSLAPTSGSGRSYADRVGVVSLLKIPSPGELESHTRQVMANNRAPGSKPASPEAASTRKHAVPMHRADASPIRHVFYIIKENRTYDQVFGDLPQGNGDPSLVQFGREVTPNHHALAEQFVLMDNFYTTGDQSSLGHQWCDEAYANDYSHKYGNARNDYAGTNPMAYAPSGFLWDNAQRNSKSVRIYGEFGQSRISPSSATWTDIYTAWKNGTPGPSIAGVTRVAGLFDIFVPAFPGFDMKITEQLRADIFLREFRDFEQNGNLPDLVMMLLPIDHTNGTSPGYPTPRAMVADNDLALGRIVEAIAKSRYWKESVILVTEDDSQNGLDHVDGHRTVGMAIGPYIRRKAVDSTLYTTVNLVRTIEQVLGLPPMNQFDLAADPMFSVFTDTPDLTPYERLANRIPLDEMNPPVGGLRGLQRKLALASMKMDFSEPDAAPEDLLNRVIWHSVKGYDQPYPQPKWSTLQRATAASAAGGDTSVAVAR